MLGGSIVGEHDADVARREAAGRNRMMRGQKSTNTGPDYCMATFFRRVGIVAVIAGMVILPEPSVVCHRLAVSGGIGQAV